MSSFPLCLLFSIFATRRRSTPFAPFASRSCNALLALLLLIVGLQISENPSSVQERKPVIITKQDS